MSTTSPIQGWTASLWDRAAPHNRPVGTGEYQVTGTTNNPNLPRTPVHHTRDRTQSGGVDSSCFTDMRPLAPRKVNRRCVMRASCHSPFCRSPSWPPAPVRPPAGPTRPRHRPRQPRRVLVRLLPARPHPERPHQERPHRCAGRVRCPRRREDRGLGHRVRQDQRDGARLHAVPDPVQNRTPASPTTSRSTRADRPARSCSRARSSRVSRPGPTTSLHSTRAATPSCARVHPDDDRDPQRRVSRGRGDDPDRRAALLHGRVRPERRGADRLGRDGRRRR